MPPSAPGTPTSALPAVQSPATPRPRHAHLCPARPPPSPLFVYAVLSLGFLFRSEFMEHPAAEVILTVNDYNLVRRRVADTVQ